MKLYLLDIVVWKADNWVAFAYENKSVNPAYVDEYLFGDKNQIDKFLKENVDYFIDSDIYNEGWIYEADIDDNEIIEIGNFDSVDDIKEYFGDELSKTSLGELASLIKEEDYDPEYIEIPNYDYDKELDYGSIIVLWSWHKYVGYARKFHELRYVTNEQVKDLVKEDSTFATQMDIVMNADDVADAEERGFLHDALYDELIDRDWKWTNEGEVMNAIDDFAN